ncbi:MAG: glycoside hydrolase, partial [Bacteroidales bacterium]|nr:glycoside hydrolase [Bacteroidales bacterium]
MKKILLLSLILSFGLFGFAQQRVKISKTLMDYSVEREFQQPIDNATNFGNPVNLTVESGNLQLDESQIGTTVYDLQSNSAVANRVVLFDDGTKAAVWTMGFDSPNFPERGSGYNYFDGNSWDDWSTVSIETQRCGWPSLAPLGTNGEIVVAHNGVDGLVINQRPQKGEGAWTESLFQGPSPDWHELLWPRITTSGPDHNTIHLVYPTTPTGNGGTVYQGMDPALLYSRSTDGGATWDPENIILEGTGSDYYNSLSADEYVWAEPVGETIAYACADPWHDWFVMKSADNGDTWEKIMVWEHPYPFFDWEVTIFTDTLWCPDNSVDIAIDADGMVHVVCGIGRVAHFELGATYSYWPWTDGIAYWNETMPAFENANQHDALDAVDVLIE